ncbi:hypothetical protein FB45DRAFT_359579 [Roridomyces roridus]|uniref:F-box domain-containing protein n=1 Tax=Roridomyces roridus TaxID=1738132 RepID=A0AAD7C824_9AGAR|nr:hypothetical protein FB45DRAFT_359579 [Roridomyces roridus]
MSLVLPQDVWQCIATFIPESELPSLISVNLALYNIVLDTKYREVNWTMYDQSLVNSLVRLRTPSIAARVRRLHIRAWFIEFLVKRQILVAPSFMANFKRSISRHLRIRSESEDKVHAPDNVLASMTAAVHLMNGVTEYSFEWRDLSPSPDTLRFLTAARTAFGISLRKLTLHAQLEHYKSLLSTVDFDNLEELELHFDHDGQGSTELLRDAIAPFINHFTHSLWNLQLVSSSRTDFSPLFNSLGRFAHLHTLVARLTFDETHFLDPQGLLRILDTSCSTLSNVEVGYSFAAAVETNPYPRSTWPHFASSLISSQSVLRDLRSLELPALNRTRFSDTALCLQRSADTLTRLCLTNCFLKRDDFEELVQMFAHRPFDSGLYSLRVGTTYLTVDVFDLLSSRLPGLGDLNLVLATDVLTPLVHHHYDPPSAFCVSLSGRSYADWQLSNLGIWDLGFNDTATAGKDETIMMEHLAQCIPSLRTFKGRPPGNLYYRNYRCDVFSS